MSSRRCWSFAPSAPIACHSVRRPSSSITWGQSTYTMMAVHVFMFTNVYPANWYNKLFVPNRSVKTIGKWVSVSVLIQQCFKNENFFSQCFAIIFGVCVKFIGVRWFRTIDESFLMSLFTFYFISTHALIDQLWIMIGLWKISFVRKFQSNMFKMHFVWRALETRIFTENIWLDNHFSTQLLCIFLKANIMSQTERKTLQILLIS